MCTLGLEGGNLEEAKEVGFFKKKKNRVMRIQRDDCCVPPLSVIIDEVSAIVLTLNSRMQDGCCGTCHPICFPVTELGEGDAVAGGRGAEEGLY